MLPYPKPVQIVFPSQPILDIKPMTVFTALKYTSTHIYYQANEKFRQENISWD
jgi:hypothetical protein